MKKWQRSLIGRVAKQTRERVEQSDRIEMINLFNSGIVIDLKKVKIKALEIVQKVCEKEGKKR